MDVGIDIEAHVHVVENLSANVLHLVVKQDDVFGILIRPGVGCLCHFNVERSMGTAEVVGVYTDRIGVGVDSDIVFLGDGSVVFRGFGVNDGAPDQIAEGFLVGGEFVPVAAPAVNSLGHQRVSPDDTADPEGSRVQVTGITAFGKLTGLDRLVSEGIRPGTSGPGPKPSLITDSQHYPTNLVLSCLLSGGEACFGAILVGVALHIDVVPAQNDWSCKNENQSQHTQNVKRPTTHSLHSTINIGVFPY